MKTRRVEYRDEIGRLWQMQVPEGYETMPEAGICLGPPDLSDMGMPVDVEVRLNHELYHRQLFTQADVRRRPNELQAAIQAALKLDVGKLRNLYRQEANDA